MRVKSRPLTGELEFESTTLYMIINMDTWVNALFQVFMKRKPGVYQSLSRIKKKIQELKKQCDERGLYMLRGLLNDIPEETWEVEVSLIGDLKKIGDLKDQIYPGGGSQEEEAEKSSEWISSSTADLQISLANQHPKASTGANRLKGRGAKLRPNRRRKRQTLSDQGTQNHEPTSLGTRYQVLGISKNLTAKSQILNPKSLRKGSRVAVAPDGGRAARCMFQTIRRCFR